MKSEIQFFTFYYSWYSTGAALGVVALDTFLKNISSSSRKIAIGIDNESGYKWTALNVYFYPGTSDKVMPHEVNSGTENEFCIREREVARGQICYFGWLNDPKLGTTSIPFSFAHNMRNFLEHDFSSRVRSLSTEYSSIAIYSFTCLNCRCITSS